MRALAPAVLMIAALAAPALADAPPTLAEVAARDKNKKKGKPITEADLYNTGRKGTVSNPGAENTNAVPTGTEEKKPDAAAGPAGAKPKTDDEIKAEQTKAWRDKIEKARADVTRLQADVNQLQTALNDVTVQQVSPARAARMERLEAAKKELATAQAQVATLEEEGRRAGLR